MSRIFPLTIILACALGLGAASSPAMGQDDQDRKLLDRVKTFYSSHRKAIASIEMKYTWDINGSRKTNAVYVRKGEMFYFASLRDPETNQPGMPTELAWDGKRVYYRGIYNSMVQSDNRSDARFSVPIPEDGVGEYINQALGFDGNAGSFLFRKAQTAMLNGQESIELEFEVPFLKGKLLAVHGVGVGYWPISVKLLKNTGNVIYETNDLSYATLEDAGNLLYYPRLVVTTSYVESKNGEGPPQNRVTWTVEAESVKINQPIESSRFVLVPWPSEVVNDRVTHKTARPEDPTWSPVGKVGFPWNIYATAIEEVMKRNPPRSAGRGGVAANARLASAEQSPASERYSWLLLPAGALLFAIAVFIYFRQHRGGLT